MDQPSPKKRRRYRRILIVVGITLIALAVAEIALSRGMAWKLKNTVADKLDAELHIKSLWYLPPVGVYVSGASLVRDDVTLAQIGPTELRLARIPWFNRPLVIKSLDVDDPLLELSRTHEGLMGGPGLVKKQPTTRRHAAKKLSDVLQLRELIVRRGKITYTDVRAAEPLPMTWSDININTDLSQQNVSQYTFALKARSGAIGDISATGSVDVDELMLKVDDLLLKLSATPDAAASPLPAPVQRFIQKYEVRGALTANARANLPLRDLDSGDYSVKLVLQDGRAFLERSDVALDGIRTTIEIEKPAPSKMPTTGPALAEPSSIAAMTRPAPATQPEMPPVIVRLLALDARSGNARLIMDRGKVWLDLTNGDWAVADLCGHIITERIATSAPTTQAREAARDIVRRLEPAGHIDFTASGSGPLLFTGKNPKAKVADYQVVAYPKDVSFAWRGFPLRFENINGGNVRLQHGIITFENLNGRYGNDDVRLTTARIPLEGIRQTVKIQEINGAIAFHMPLEEYPETMFKLLQQFTPTGTYMIAGDLALIPKRHAEALATTAPTTRKVVKDYNLMVSTDRGGLMFSEQHIPITDMRADFMVTPDRLTTKNAQGRLLGGSVAANVDYQRSPELSEYKTRIVIKDAKLEELDQVLVAGGEQPRKMTGRVFTSATLNGKFSKDQSPLDGMNGAGEAEIIQGEFLHLPVLYQLLGNVKGLKTVSTVGEAATSFAIDKRQVTLTNTAISSPLVGMQGSGTIGFDGSINARAIVAPLADWKDKIKETRIPLVSAFAGEIVGNVQKLLNSATSNLIYQFRVEGAVKDPKINPIPTPFITDSAAFVFGKMVQGVKDGDLLRTVKQAPESKEPKTQ